MTVLMIRSQVRPDAVDEVEAAVRAVFAAIDEAQPPSIRYAACTLPDGVTFVALLEVADGAENPLPALPAFGEFQAVLQRCLAGPPAAEPLEVVGSYRFFG